MLEKERKFRGFTLVEMVVVLLILAVLAAFAIPSYLGYLDNTNINLDKLSLSRLNSFTKYYKMNKNITTTDVFEGISNDTARMQILVASNYLDEIITAKKQNASFSWDITNQKWLYNLNAGINYQFSTLNPNDFRKTLTWTSGADGFYSNRGLLFIDNKKSDYLITNKATLGTGIPPNITAGGYGILFETTLNSTDLDTGYALQFDRGLGGIAIRKRVNGNEQGPLLTITNSNNAYIPASKYDAWWTKEREIKMQVSSVQGQTGKKKLTVQIDNVTVIDNFIFASSIEATNNFTGFRSWDAGTSYSAMTIE
ncbi:MAG: prepilin-type N-terminal cleavage/methylation domain-containing protein [Clostridia bacterium]